MFQLEENLSCPFISSTSCGKSKFMNFFVIQCHAQSSRGKGATINYLEEQEEEIEKKFRALLQEKNIFQRPFSRKNKFTKASLRKKSQKGVHEGKINLFLIFPCPPIFNGRPLNMLNKEMLNFYFYLPHQRSR